MAMSAPMMQAAAAAARKAPPTAANHAHPEQQQQQQQQQQRPVLPFRALSAYNFFFRDERDRIINGGEHEFTSTKKQKLLSEHWFRDRSVKRRHRKTHGKIAFTTLSKVISQGWRDLPEDKKAFYREVAAEDLDRYQRELDQYKLMDAANGGGVAALFASSNVTSVGNSHLAAAGAAHDDPDDGSSGASKGNPHNRAKAA
jgi:HMG (high mobility group) box